MCLKACASIAGALLGYFCVEFEVEFEANCGLFFFFLWAFIC